MAPAGKAPGCAYRMEKEESAPLRVVKAGLRWNVMRGNDRLSSHSDVADAKAAMLRHK